MDCSDHGICSAAANGEPTCECDEGYEGSLCGSCAAGFHRSAQQTCVPDQHCADQELDLCGAHGSCEDEEGVIRCDCDAAYEGARCQLCISGFGRNEAGDCLQLVIVVDGGALQTPPADR